MHQPTHPLATKATSNTSVTSHAPITSDKGVFIDPTIIETAQRLINCMIHRCVHAVSLNDADQHVRVVNTPWPTHTTDPNVPTTKKPEADLASTSWSITSPHVGRVQWAADAIATPFVEIGSHVKAGDTVAVVVAQAALLPVISDSDGQVSAVLVAQGESVDFSQPLLTLV